MSQNSVMQNIGIRIQVLTTKWTIQNVDRTLKNSLLIPLVLRSSYKWKPKLLRLVCFWDFLLFSFQNLWEGFIELSLKVSLKVSLSFLLEQFRTGVWILFVLSSESWGKFCWRTSVPFVFRSIWILEEVLLNFRTSVPFVFRSFLPTFQEVKT